jgi:CBS domain-containing protein
MMLDPDQDNGLILGEVHDGSKAEVEAWFESFSDRLNVNLDKSGYILCPGDIMARNPMYRKTLASWRDQITHIARGPSQKAARWSNVFFDFDTLYGDDALTHSLRAHVNDQLEENLGLLKYMVEDDAEGRAPISWFNRLIATGEKDGKETVDVKRNGLRMVANAARILALRSGISQCNTSERMESLIRHGVLSADFGATVSSAYDELLDMLLSHQLGQKQAGIPLDKEVAPEDLTPPAREALRVSMRAVKRFQEKLQDEIIGLAI